MNAEGGENSETPNPSGNKSVVVMRALNLRDGIRLAGNRNDPEW